MPDEPLLREKAREAILAGRMPRTKPSRTFGGSGADEPCAVCGESIQRADMEIEIEVNRHDATPGLDRYHLHVRCFAAWELVRTKIQGTGEPPRLTP